MSKDNQCRLNICENCVDTFIGTTSQILCTTCQIAINIGDMYMYNNRKDKFLKRTKQIEENMSRRRKKKHTNRIGFHNRKKHTERKIYVVGDQASYAKWIEGWVLVNSIEESDLVIFTGGSDVNPELYGERVGEQTLINANRDKSEVEIFKKALKLNKKMLGICRGAQFLCVMAGGKLIQHCNNHAIAGSHECIDTEGDTFDMTSTHHQMMYPFELHDDKFTMIAYSLNKRSNNYLNGNNEKIRLPKDFVEAEVVLFQDIDALCIQGHPERMGKYSSGVKVCTDYLNNFMKANFKNKTRLEQV